jgi:hypothetical protein
MKRVQQLLDYAATQEPTVLIYRASDMILAIHHRDASYLNEKMPTAVEQGDITSYPKMFPIQQTTEQFTTRHQ